MAQSASVRRFTKQHNTPSQSQQKTLPKDHVPLRRGELTNDMNQEQRKAKLKEFQQRVSKQSGNRDKYGFAHVEDVAAKKKQTQEQGTKQTKNASQQQKQQSASVQRFRSAQTQTQAKSQTQTQSKGISR